MMNKSKPKTRTTSRSPKTRWTIGGIAAAGITVIILIAVLIWIPGAQNANQSGNADQISWKSTLSFSSFADGTDLEKTTPPVFIGSDIVNVQITAINGFATIQGLRPRASLIFRNFPTTFIGQSIEINYLFMVDKSTDIYFNSDHGQLCYVTLNPFYVACGGGAGYYFSGLRQDDPVTLTITFSNTTNFVMTMKSSKFIGRSVGIYSMTVTNAMSISSLKFYGVFPGTSTVTLWKLASIKTTWDAFPVYA